MKRRASVEWKGGKDGQGTISTESGAIRNASYSMGTRFEEQKGTNPEELIAAAHASCFSMALAVELSKAGLSPKSIKTESAVGIERLAQGWTVTESHLDVKAEIPDASNEQFETAANNAKANCPISRLLKADITMTATLV